MATQIVKRNYSIFRSAEDGNVYLFLGGKWYNMSNRYSIGKQEIPGGYKECAFLGNIAGKGDELAAMIEVAKEVARGNYSEPVNLWEKHELEHAILTYEDSFDVFS